MSAITIDTGYLQDLAEYAENAGKGVAKRANEYWNKLNNEVVNKINQYSGDHTYNITSAKTNTNQYKSQLSAMASSFITFATKTRELKEKAENHEAKVIGTINTDLRAFCNKHGLEYKEMQEKPGFWAGLWNSICNKFHDWKNRWDEFKERFKDWFHYDGGKEIIEGVFAVVLAIVAIVAAIAAFPATLALLTGATILGTICALAVIVASAVSIGLAVLNAAVKLGHAVEAVNAACEDRYFDAAWETKKRNEASFSEFLRDCGMYDLANLVDVIDMACTVITFIYDASKFLTKASNWIKGFSFKGFVGDFWKNTKEFFKGGPGKWLFGSEYDGKFFGGDVADVIGRIKTVLTVANSTYNMVSYHDATHHKSEWTKFVDQINNAKPIIDIVTSNYKDAALTQRHDIVTDPKSEQMLIQKTGVDANGNQVTITESKQDVVDATTGDVVGERKTRVETNADGSTKTTTTTSYKYTNSVTNKTESKTIREVKTTNTDGSTDVTKNTDTTTTKLGNRQHKTEQKTVTHETSETHEGADGYKRTSTTKDSTTTSSVNAGYGKGSDTKSTSHSEKTTVTNSDGTSYENSSDKTTNVSHQTHTATTGGKTSTETSMTNSSSEKTVYSTGDGGNKYATSSKSDSHSATMKTDANGKVNYDSSTQTTKQNIGVEGKGTQTTTTETSSKNGTKEPVRTDSGPKTSTVRENAPTATTPKDPYRPTEREWQGNLNHKSEVISEKTDTISQPSLRKTIDSYNKTADKVNSTIAQVTDNPDAKVLYTTEDIPGVPGEIINDAVESTSTTKKVLNAIEFIQKHGGQ